MPDRIRNDLLGAMRDRKASLWLCQRHSLTEDHEPHDYSLPSQDAAYRYRIQANEADLALSECYWRAVWSEAAINPIVHSMRSQAAETESAERRDLVMLASEADVESKVSMRQFLPFAVLPGCIDPEMPRDAQYGVLRGRARDRVAWGLAMRLKFASDGVLVVVGAQDHTDVDLLRDLLLDYPFPSLRVIVVSPSGANPLIETEAAGIDVVIWQGEVADFCAAARAEGVPTAGQAPSMGIYVQNQFVDLTTEDIGEITEAFAIITARDLSEPETFDMRDLDEFLSGSLETWKGYAAGLPFKRAYKVVDGNTLPDYLVKVLSDISKVGGKPVNRSLVLPSEGGAGASTLLRSSAFYCAKNGFPTLVLKPDVPDINAEQVLAFAGAVSDRSIESGVEDMPAFALFFDSEHSASFRTSIHQLSQLMVSSGRKVLTVIVREPEESETEKCTSQSPIPILKSTAQELDVAMVADSFRRFTQRWQLPIEPPSLDDWQAYERATRWSSDDFAGFSGSMFWVTLHFFITQGMGPSDADTIRISIASWIRRRAEHVSDSTLSRFVDFVAALSTWRIVSPLWSALRPVTGGTFSQELVTTLSEIGDLVIWGNYNDTLDDETVHFRHPALAIEYLRMRDIRTDSDKIKLLAPLIRALSSGHAADVWVAESIAFRVLTPKFQRRPAAEYEWRITAFEMIPDDVKEQSKTILHHWARCLYLSVESDDNTEISSAVKRSRYESAIEILKRACEMPRKPLRDENPSHLWNTLGTAYYRYARFLSNQGAFNREVKAAWDSAAEAFQRAIDLSGGQNIEAYLAFSARLVDRIEMLRSSDSSDTTSALVTVVVNALSLLDQAEEMIEIMLTTDESWEYDLKTYRMRALNVLDADEARAFVDRLAEDQSSDLAAYCKAVLLLGNEPSDEDILSALRAFSEAESNAVHFSYRSLALYSSLMRRHPSTRYDYSKHLSLIEALESSHEYVFRPIDQFRYAVLCYQNGEFDRGARRFRQLREIQRDPNIPTLIVRDYWRDPVDPKRAKETFARVGRIRTRWRAEGYVDDLGQTIPIRPRHFRPEPKEGDVVRCVIRFESNGPLVVPTRFAGSSVD